MKHVWAQVKAVEDESPNGSFEVILSAPTLDRDGEKIASGAFDPLPDHITFDYDHGMTVSTTVGSGTPRYENGALVVRGTFSSIPRAQEVRTLVREGHIRTTSVAFMGAEYDRKDGTPVITKAELLNGAFVAIPSNREALVLSAKGHGTGTSTDEVRRLCDEAAISLARGAAAEAKLALASAPPLAARPVREVLAEAKGLLAGLSPGGMRKGHGMTARDLRSALDAAVGEAHGGRDRYVWVRDYTDEWVVFSVMSESDLASRDTFYQQNYSVTNGVVALTGDPAEVLERTVYAPKSFDARRNHGRY